MSSIFDDGPVSLPHLRMVKQLAELLEPLGENGILPAEHHTSWADFFRSHDMTADEAEKIGKWYVKHHTICPSMPDISTALTFLRKHKTLPSQRITSPTELLAGELLQFLSERGIELPNAVRALAQAAALAQLAYYRADSPRTDRTYVKMELEGIARQADFFADDILAEARQGVGGLAHLEPYLFPEPDSF